MFKLPGLPSASADNRELADFMEWLSIKLGRCSESLVSRDLTLMGDDIYDEGCENDEDLIRVRIEDAIDEIDRRRDNCASGYPFDLDPTGSLLVHNNALLDERAIVYRYLLLCTRLKMNENRVHAGHDGAQLFEELSAHAIRNYLGL
ncbi:MAG: hypothetical protein HC888_19915, partial [Candidatus Competibacteraceae bacterium]|nr:hypothetical protein [Candidatus Competibacteraceae bacterium]